MPSPARAATSMTRVVSPLESSEAVSLIEWRDHRIAVEPRLRKLFHIPNGGKRPARVGAELKSHGVRKGMLDYCLPVPSLGYPGAFFELKRTVGGKLEPEQAEVIAELRADGFYVAVCKGWADMARAICDYLDRPDLATELWEM